MKSVPVGELAEAWIGTKKTIETCRRGRGFGTRDERVGGASEKAPNVESPRVPSLQIDRHLPPRQGGSAAFYGCPKYAAHPAKKFIIDAESWVREHSVPAPSVTPPPTAGEVFGNGTPDRDPGMEG